MLHIIIATVPWRRPAFRNMLSWLTNQTLKPDLVHLVLDGYGDAASAPCSLPTREWRTTKCLGPGGRWRVLKELAPETIVVVFDDDISLGFAPYATERLVKIVEQGYAAALMGVTFSGCMMNIPEGERLICGGAATFAFRAKDLEGLDEFVSEIKTQGKFDPFGDLGDDEAVISALLWKRGVVIKKANIPEIHSVQGTQEGSQARRRLASTRPFWYQRQEIKRITGWPWPLKKASI